MTLLPAVTTMASTRGALAADNPDPTFTLTPASGPPGTHVTITGRLSAAQLPVWAPMLSTPDVFLLLADLSANCAATLDVCTPGPASLEGCELMVGVTNEVACFQSMPDAAPRWAPAGRYALSIGCQACEVATFTLTAPSTLPFTGFPVLLTSLCGFLLVGTGLLLLRRRPPNCA
jgi:hypothetical protein